MATGLPRIIASEGAFTAVLDDGSVVAWGQADSGGTVVRDELGAPE